MLLKNEYSKEFLNEKLEEYASTYDDSINMFFKCGMMYYLYEGLYTEQLACEVYQMYHEYDLTRKSIDIYYRFRDFLKQVYSDFDKRKIVEVGAGIVPQLAREIAKESKEEVIAIDKIITSRNNPNNLITVKKEFLDDTEINDRNLMIGLHPCDATIDMVKSAANNNIDFAIAVCGCTFNEPFYGWHSFISDVQSITKNSDLGEVNVVDTEFSPIIYTKK